MVSVSFQSPMRWPSREPLSTWGARLMFSWPPATPISLSPVATACAASMTAFRPEPHTALIVSAGVSLATPAFIMAWRAGFWPQPAASTWPMMTSPTWSGATRARARASRITRAPRSVAGVLASAPPNLPTGVRTAETMTMSSMVNPLCCDACRRHAAGE